MKWVGMLDGASGVGARFGCARLSSTIDAPIAPVAASAAASAGTRAGTSGRGIRCQVYVPAARIPAQNPVLLGAH
jgi:hypothetical protein